MAAMRNEQAADLVQHIKRFVDPTISFKEMINGYVCPSSNKDDV